MNTPAARPDRYQSFAHIPCDAMALKLLTHLEQLLQAEDTLEPFWQLFLQKAAIAKQPQPGQADALKLICSNSYYIFDLFAAQQDQAGEAMMDELEYQCC
ncbi:conserved hypothetical protein [Magnetococcus marinus MC-1]|uniref:N(2)-fixation sustaining protein CowN n=1 Tax=Magnetococcus marinus (strain ATCC BAA-1437 / JCM 17883 / MC-1) TaxID=156889 RepID=COWN_MAGMM|nr:N(2)-fixation sustaining protein CowN [Magnetococcus marinus]A0L6W5.1 RecName: Full=N(2)-fixation sustaining protein CowN; AltName: Full=CO weal-nitrogenase [Magnetococcus marinus MC-1]ABK43708.1 conserved hypothetical protein [Magnetococcus marinus MC-1]